MTELDDKINRLLKNQGVKKNEPDQPAAKPAAKKKAPAKKKTKKRPAKKKAVATSKVDPELFAHRYIQYHCNGTAAYLSIRPDVKPESAAVSANKLLRTAKVQNVIWPLLEALLEKESAQSEWVIKRWLEQAEASPLDYFTITSDGNLGGLDLTNLSPAQRRNLKSIKYNKTTSTSISAKGTETETVTERWDVTVVDQQKAVELMAKMLGMLTPQLEKETEDRIGELLERGVQRIRKMGDPEAWRTLEGEFSEVG